MQPHTRISLSARPLIIALAALTVLLSAMPAGAAGRFVDDDGNPHEPNIDKIAEMGITKGCTSDSFCPDDAVTRGQMATFIVRALDLPSTDDRPFTDTDDHGHEADIAALAAAEITRGCSADTFCPDDAVTRAETASFLARALGLTADGTTDTFTDDDNSPHETSIEAIAEEGITNGCTTTRFCPDVQLTRAQMATLLARALGVASPVVPPTTSVGDMVVVAAGASIQAAIDAHPAGTHFLLSSGVYSGQTVQPKEGNVIQGEPGAVLDGNGADAAFLGTGADNVVIDGLVIRDYAPGHEEAAIRSINGSRDWTIRNTEITDITGIATNASPGWQLIDNHLHHNTQYGIRGLGAGILIQGNEISHNNVDGGTNPYCCAGGTKFIHTSDLVLRDNYVHNNNGPGLWVDGYNTNTLYEGNRVVANAHAGIKHEISCDAVIRNNHAEGNGFEVPHWVEGGGIVVMNSPNVQVYGNFVKNNHDGIGAIHADRSIPDNHPCPIELRNLDVHDNTIIMEVGHTGIATNQTSAPYTSWNNRFHGNDYQLGSNETYFRWQGEITAQEWVAAGNDTDGTGLD